MKRVVVAISRSDSLARTGVGSNLSEELQEGSIAGPSRTKGKTRETVRHPGSTVVFLSGHKYFLSADCGRV